MTNRIKQFDAIVTLLETIEVDGEMMEYIINQCGMREQIIHQLTHSLTNETNSYGTFDGSGYEHELAECMGIEVETLENLKGARIQILCDATGDDEYFDVVFLNYYDEEEQPLVINALSKEHITFE